MMHYMRFETLIGAVVLVVSAVFLTVLLGVKDSDTGGDGYMLRADFRSAAGINAGSDVLMAGVRVGRVRDITLDSQSYRAIVALNINAGLHIPDDSAIAISQEGLLGGSYVEIIPGGSEFFMAPGDVFIDTQGSVSLISLLLKFAAQGQR